MTNHTTATIRDDLRADDGVVRVHPGLRATAGRRSLATAVLLAGAAWLAAGGCRMGPDAPTAPEAPAADALDASVSDAVRDMPVDPRWWESLGDPVLDGLVADAERANQSLAAALASVRAAYAGLGVAEAELWPSIGAGAEYARTKTNIAQLAAQGVQLEPYDMYAYGVGMPAWEIDLWGGVRRQVEMAASDAAGEVETLRGALVSVRAQVVANYAQLRMLAERRAVLEENAAGMRRSRDAVAARRAAGTATALDLARAEAELDAAEAGLPAIESAWRATFAALAVLVGKTPAELETAVGGELAARAPVPTPPDAVGIGLPADLVARRPDVRAAWQRLVGATAAIGAADALRLPTLTLSGNFYIAATEVSGLGRLSNRAYSFGPSLSVPILAGGALKANAERAKAAADAALASYRETVLGAIGDLSASVSGYVGAREGAVLASRAADSAREALRLADEQFRAGVTDVTVLLEVQRSALSAEDAAVEARGAEVQAFVSLCRALGSGWQDADLDRAAAEAAETRGGGGERSADGGHEPAE
ncbi:MAG: hypothetical protein RI967_1081 [Planctomycetota bacterium]